MDKFEQNLRIWFQIYKTLPCLWKRDDPDFGNMDIMNMAWSCMSKMYEWFGLAKIHDNGKKSKTVLDSYITRFHTAHEEQKKLKLEGKLGIPSFKYYNELEFLENHKKEKPVKKVESNDTLNASMESKVKIGGQDKQKRKSKKPADPKASTPQKEPPLKVFEETFSGDESHPDDKDVQGD